MALATTMNSACIDRAKGAMTATHHCLVRHQMSRATITVAAMTFSVLPMSDTQCHNSDCADVRIASMDLFTESSLSVKLRSGPMSSRPPRVISTPHAKPGNHARLTMSPSADFTPGLVVSAWYRSSLVTDAPRWASARCVGLDEVSRHPRWFGRADLVAGGSPQVGPRNGFLRQFR